MSSVGPNESGIAAPDAAGKLADRGWRLRHSAWMLAPILGFGLLTWAGFAYIGVKARRRDWWLPALIYAAAMVILIAVPSEKTASGTSASDWTGGAILALWVAGIVHAALVNKGWLRWMVTHSTPWYALAPQTSPAWQGPAPQSHPGHVPPELSGMGVDGAQFYGTGPAAQSHPVTATGSAPGPAVRVPPTAPGLPSGQAPVPGPQPPLDVNVATGEQLATLPGFDGQRAAHVLTERQVRRGFATLEEFAQAAALSPHELVRVREVVICSPPAGTTHRPPGIATSGRVLDV